MSRGSLGDWAMGAAHQGSSMAALLDGPYSAPAIGLFGPGQQQAPCKWPGGPYEVRVVPGSSAAPCQPPRLLARLQPPLTRCMRLNLGLKFEPDTRESRALTQ